MKYKQLDSNQFSSAAPSGTVPVPVAALPAFRSWQPSTWPRPPRKFTPRFTVDLRQIFDESMLGEISNVIHDITKSNGDLQQRGHVVAIALMCALDAIASYGYRGKHISKFVKNHFPDDYKPYANDIYKLYRNSLIHSWNLFEATMWPGNERIRKTRRTLEFGLLNFLDALQQGVTHFLVQLQTDAKLQTNTLNRYRKLKNTAKP